MTLVSEPNTNSNPEPNMAQPVLLDFGLLDLPSDSGAEPVLCFERREGRLPIRAVELTETGLSWLCADGLREAVNWSSLPNWTALVARAGTPEGLLAMEQDLSPEGLVAADRTPFVLSVCPGDLLDEAAPDRFTQGDGGRS